MKRRGVLNAAALGLALPQKLLLQATEVID
jgi:hypothetical protein